MQYPFSWRHGLYFLMLLGLLLEAVYIGYTLQAAQPAIWLPATAANLILVAVAAWAYVPLVAGTPSRPHHVIAPVTFGAALWAARVPHMLEITLSMAAFLTGGSYLYLAILGWRRRRTWPKPT